MFTFASASVKSFMLVGRFSFSADGSAHEKKGQETETQKKQKKKKKRKKKKKDSSHTKTEEKRKEKRRGTEKQRKQEAQHTFAHGADLVGRLAGDRAAHGLLHGRVGNVSVSG